MMMAHDNMRDPMRGQELAAGGAMGALALALSIMIFAVMPVLVFAAAPPGGNAARASPRLASLQIEIWPEYDRRQAALVILKGELAEDAALPATVSLRIPASSGGPTAVAFSPTAGGELFNLGYERINAADFITLRLQALQRYFHVEFYDPLTTSASDRSYTYVWPGDLAVARLSVRFQQPAGASGFSVRPELSAGTAGPDGLLYWTADLSAAAADKQLPFEIRYTKTDARTSTEILGLKAADATPAATGGAGEALPDWLLVIAIAAGVIGIAGVAGTMWWRRRQKVSGARPGGANFCAQCGSRLSAGRFCSACGAPIGKS
ncbi:MAG: zinc ribbon domain-containing protein [Betaproteobacteria bacterium]|nr:zinc ribbon domain-containing protein [Betaproteobacteria bacterium]